MFDGILKLPIITRGIAIALAVYLYNGVYQEIVKDTVYIGVLFVAPFPFLAVISPVLTYELLLGFFLLIPLYSTDPSSYYLHGVINFHSRFFFGVSSFELAMFSALIVAMIRRISSNGEQLRRRWVLLAFMFFTGFEIIVGMIYVFSGIAQTEIDDVFVSALPYIYFLVLTIVGLHAYEAGHSYRKILGIVGIYYAILITIGGVRLLLAFQGEIDVFRKYGLLNPIYGEASLIVWGIGITLLGSYKSSREQVIWYILSIAALGELLLSGIRMHLVQLAIMGMFSIFGGVVLSFSSKKKSGSGIMGHFLKRFSVLIFTGASILLFLGIYYPNYYEGVVKSGESILQWSGEDQSNTTRTTEIDNILLNLKNNPVYYVVGAGLGTRWYEYIPQPQDSGAFLNERDIGIWKVVIHFPPLEVLFRFGVVGLLLYLLVPWLVLKRCLRNIESHNSLTITLVVFSLFSSFWMFLPFRVPRAAFMCSVCYLILEGIFMETIEKAENNKILPRSV